MESFAQWVSVMPEGGRGGERAYRRRTIKKLCYLCTSLTVLLFSASVVQAQQADDEMVLGGMTLRLGMSQDEVFQKLGAIYDVRPVGGVEGMWNVGYRGGVAVAGVGSVQFQDGRLIIANRSWDVQEQSASSLAEGFYEAVRLITSGDWAHCSARNWTPPGSTMKQVLVDCGSRRVMVWFDPEYGSGVSMSLSSSR